MRCCLWTLAILSSVLLINGDQFDNRHRLDCALIYAESKNNCQRSGCIVDEAHPNIPHTPTCYLNANKQGYQTNNIIQQKNGFEASLKIKSDTKKIVELKDFVDEVKLSVEYLTSKIVRFKLTDPHHNRYEVPVQRYFTIPADNGVTNEAKKYEVNLDKGDHFNLIIKRKENGVKMIDTSIGPMLFTDKFLQFATYLPSENLYGLGENYHLHLRHNMNYTTLPIFTLDSAPNNLNGHYYGAHPFYMVIENDGKAHGVFLLNSNAMAYTTLPAPGISLKTTGGILDFFVFVGENPEEVVQLYTSIIGRPVMPPFWGLGFQLCRYGYKGTDDVKNVVQRNLDNNIPIDVLYVDIDYMDERRDFTIDQHSFKQLPQYVQQTKKNNHVRWTFIIDPAIQGDLKGYRAFDEGYKQDVFIKWPSNVPIHDRKNPEKTPNDKNVFYGHVWPSGPVAFPDFLTNKTQNWWINMIKEFHHQVEFDALWIDMNEPSNFKNDYCPNDDYNLEFSNLKLGQLQRKTICMGLLQGEHGEYRHYDVHSLYGWSETIPTQKGVHEATGKRGFVVSRSTYPSSGRFGSHWLGDNMATWEQLNQSIIGMIEFNLFGINFVGADICGFSRQTTPELCRRWYQLGAFYPFSRSHNDKHEKPKDPAYFMTIGHPEVASSMKQAYEVRYQLLHYYYTLFYRAHTKGETIIRSVAHEFPTILKARTIDDQFFIGSSILVSPFLKENQTKVLAYVPPGRWYHFNDLFVLRTQSNIEHFEFLDTESHRPLLFREGLILPIVADLPKPLNTYELRRKPIELWIMPKENGEASGDLFWDDGESIDTIGKGQFNYFEFYLLKCKLTIKSLHHGLAGGKGEISKISTINIALNKSVKLDAIETTVNGENVIATVIQSYLTIPLEDHLDLYQTNKTIDIVFSSNEKCFIP